ncbi:MAG: MFS transporter [Spirochaetia bacterium]|nr:MFS transporter [Spirochaetia bacterium]
MKKIDYKWMALSCTSLGAFFSAISGNTFIVALPVIMTNLKASFQEITWAMMGYMLVIAVAVPAIGRVADMVGRKKLFVSGFVVFTLGSLLCGLSRSGMELLIYRLIQAVGGALIMANSIPIVTDAFEKKELGMALGINGMIISVGGVVGPIIGGLLINAGWRSIFFINVPIGIIGSVWAALQLEEMDVLPEKQKFDWTGTIFFTAGMMALMLALTLGGLEGWMKPRVLILFAAAAVLLPLFVYIEYNSEEPMLDMRLFESRLLAFAYSSNLLNGIARGAVTFLLIFYFQGIKSMDPLQAAIMLIPFVLPQVLMSPLCGWLSDRIGSRLLSSAGLLISALGLIGFMWISPSTSYTQLVISMTIMGFGSGMFFSPNTKAIMQAVPVEKRGIAGGVRTMMNNLGMIISMAFSMAVISSSITPEAFAGLFTGTQVGTKGIAVGEFITGLRTIFFISFLISLLAAFISYLRGAEPDWRHDARHQEAVIPEGKNGDF